jgi:hypothetical protein
MSGESCDAFRGTATAKQWHANSSRSESTSPLLVAEVIAIAAAAAHNRVG